MARSEAQGELNGSTTILQRAISEDIIYRDLQPGVDNLRPADVATRGDVHGLAEIGAINEASSHLDNYSNGGNSANPANVRHLGSGNADRGEVIKGAINDSSKTMAQNGNHLDGGNNRGALDNSGSAAAGSLGREWIGQVDEVTNETNLENNPNCTLITSSGSFGRSLNRNSSGKVDNGSVNAKTQNRLSPPLPNRAANLRTVANPLFRLARPVELGNRDGQVDRAREVSGTGSTYPLPVNVEPVPPVIIPRKRGTGSTKKATARKGSKLQPPSVTGHRWKDTGYGWELWSRTPSVSESGKRSSTSRYLTYYSKADMEDFIREQSKANS